MPKRSIYMHIFPFWKFYPISSKITLKVKWCGKMRDKLSKVFIWLLFPAIVLTKLDNENGTFSSGRNNNKESEAEKQFSDWAGRQFASRMLWMTHKRRIVLPKGTILQITPKVTVPVFRHAPYDGGFDSDIQASWTFYMKFDKLNMTSADHPWPFFDRPPFYPFGDQMRPQVENKKKTKEDEGSSSQEENEKKANKDSSNKPFPNIKYVAEAEKAMHTVGFKNYYPAFYSNGRNNRKPRSIMSLPPPESIFGGERAIILPTLEGVMSSMGFSGRSCLLRAVCEVHEFPLGTGGYGLFGELITLFFSISESPYAESHLPEYLLAETNGRKGDCSSYAKNCTKSLFVWEPRETFSDIKLETVDNSV